MIKNELIELRSWIKKEPGFFIMISIMFLIEILVLIWR